MPRAPARGGAASLSLGAPAFTLRAPPPPRSGAILTKMDGDSRGGAALSVREVSGKPIKFVGTGEKMDAMELFYPERMAQRILGMGDMLSLYEKAQDTISEADARVSIIPGGGGRAGARWAPGWPGRAHPGLHIAAAADATSAVSDAACPCGCRGVQAFQERLESQKFDFTDFLNQFKQVRTITGPGLGRPAGAAAAAQAVLPPQPAAAVPRCHHSSAASAARMRGPRAHAPAACPCPLVGWWVQINNMGGLKMLKMMPGFNAVSEKQLYEVEKKLKAYEAMINRWGGDGGGGGAQLRAGRDHQARLCH